MKLRLIKLEHRFPRLCLWIRRGASKGEHAFHISYLSLVGYEAHGHYRWAAIGLVTCIVLHAIAGEVED